MHSPWAGTGSVATRAGSADGTQADTPVSNPEDPNSGHAICRGLQPATSFVLNQPRAWGVTTLWVRGQEPRRKRNGEGGDPGAGVPALCSHSGPCSLSAPCRTSSDTVRSSSSTCAAPPCPRSGWWDPHTSSFCHQCITFFTTYLLPRVTDI